MTSVWYLEFLLFLLLQSVYSEKPEPMFRAQGSNIEMGYCFGVDYIVVYRTSSAGDQLLGNSSANTPSTPPADLRGRIYINQKRFLFGLQILNLTTMDSADYRKECWQNQTLVSQLTQQLFVCNEEIESEEIIVKEEGAATELLCDSTSIRLDGTSVLWYHEMYPSYKLTLFVDSSVSLEPLVEEMQSLVKVKDKGALLVVDNSVLKSNLHFYCLVLKGKNCLSFQNMYLPDYSESRDVFASQGDKIVLNCPANGYKQHWETPLGRLNSSSTTQAQMYITSGDKDFSLVIPSVSNEHSGGYSCISSSREMQYEVVLCPIKPALPPKNVFEGENITLECEDNQRDHRVQWYRRQTSKKHTTEIISDSDDLTVFMPEDLKDRLSLSTKCLSLTISNLEMNDGGVYFCVVLRGLEFLEEDDYTVTDYTEEDTGDDEFGYDQNWNYPGTCIFKQETVLTVKDQKRKLPKSINTPTTDPQAPSNITAYAVVAGVVGLVGLVVLVGVIVTVIVLKRKAKASTSTAAQDPATNKMLGNDG